MSVKSSIKSITKSLESIQDDRTYLIKHTRDAVSLCSQSIIAVHGQDLPTAKKKAAEASRLVKKYRPKAVGSLSKYLSMPEQEYTEAMAVIAIAEKKTHTYTYHLEYQVARIGLLDIGEMKRMMLDLIRC